MKVISLYPYKIILTATEAFLLPDSNWRDPYLLLLPEELAVVEFAGCLCDECLAMEGRRRATGEEIVDILNDRGYTSALIPDYSPHGFRRLFYESGNDFPVATEWLLLESRMRDRVIPTTFTDRRSLLHWLLQQPEVLFEYDQDDCISQVNLVRVASLRNKLVPNWNPPLEFPIELTEYARKKEHVGDWKFPANWNRYLP